MKKIELSYTLYKSANNERNNAASHRFILVKCYAGTETGFVTNSGGTAETGSFHPVRSPSHSCGYQVSDGARNEETDASSIVKGSNSFANTGDSLGELINKIKEEKKEEKEEGGRKSSRRRR